MVPERGRARHVLHLALRRLGEYKTTVAPLLDEINSAVNRRRAGAPDCSPEHLLQP